MGNATTTVWAARRAATRGRERLVEAIISVQHDFRRVLVITHIQELKDMFPVQIEIVKTPNGSIWNIV